MAKTRKRTERIARFVAEYLVDLCGSDAVRRAGFAGKRPDVQASKLLADPETQALLKAKTDDLNAAAGLTQFRVVKGLLKEAEEGGINATHGARVAAWQALGKHLGMFSDKVIHSGTVILQTTPTDERL